MLLTKFDPAKDLRELEERLMSAFNMPAQSKGELANISGFTPAVNTREGEFAYHIEVDLPGVNKKDIHVDLKDDVLTISGERKIKNEVKKKDYYKMESSYGKFQRSFTLPENADSENIKANCEDGMLEVVIPKMKKIDKDVKKIDVK
ncbi:MAG: Hsp20/alpha crystallin family protein [Sulfurovum sp.]|jgi:HSP20 family protein|nr:Hsp20/alpha crystallin family protein [Sulfurovum sp.]